MKNKFKLMRFLSQSGEFKAEGDRLTLYGVIGDEWDGNTGKRITEQIRMMEGDIEVYINSSGGNVFDGLAIMNALREHEGKVHVTVDGLAASIASAIAVGAGDKITMLKGSMMMIHEPFAFTCGNAGEIRKTADTLDSIALSLAHIYADKTGKSLDEIKEAMKAETWFTSSEALSWGLVDEAEDKESEGSVKNFDLTIYNNVPHELRRKMRSSKPATIRELEFVLRDAGFSRTEAKAVASGGFTTLDRREAEEGNNNYRAIFEALKDRRKLFKTGAEHD